MFHAIGECQVALRKFAPLWIPAFEGWKQSVLTDRRAWHRLLTLLLRPAAEPELRAPPGAQTRFETKEEGLNEQAA
jgi:hypothetical protein